jgi:hypothetical protein
MAYKDWKQYHLTKDLIKLCENLTIDDWRQIRKGDYYQIRDSYVINGNNKYKEQIMFIKQRVEKYLSEKT